MLRISNISSSKVTIRGMHTTAQPEQSPVEVYNIGAGVHALGSRISFILDSQKRRESASFKGREGKRPPSKNLSFPSPAAMATWVVKEKSSSTQSTPPAPLIPFLGSFLSNSNPQEEPARCQRRLTTCQWRRHKNEGQTECDDLFAEALLSSLCRCKMS